VCVCVFISAEPITKMFAWGEGDSRGHVLRGTTSRGLCGLICPSHTSERSNCHSFLDRLKSGTALDLYQEMTSKSGRTEPIFTEKHPNSTVSRAQGSENARAAMHTSVRVLWRWRRMEVNGQLKRVAEGRGVAKKRTFFFQRDFTCGPKPFLFLGCSNGIFNPD
jgi:hypothetical protein